jgi:L-asparaginase II
VVRDATKGKTMSSNPVIAEVTRGGIVESRHRGAFVVCDVNGKIMRSAGDIQSPVFPRSAIKAFQCVPLIESGGADRFGLNDEEIALCCSSHNGEADHVRVAASILAKAGQVEAHYECGAHWPHERKDVIALASKGEEPRAIHNNCSGKHAGMLALATHLGAPTSGYVKLDHPVQQAVAATIARFCDVDVSALPAGIDGCSVPTWAYPLHNMALGFARLGLPDCAAGQRIIRAVRDNPVMIEGTRGFDSRIMKAVPRLFLKYGAEAVYCGLVPHAALGFALKVDDGGKRAAQVAVARLLMQLDVWSADELSVLSGFSNVTLKNWRGLEVGAVRAPVSR